MPVLLGGRAKLGAKWAERRRARSSPGRRSTSRSAWNRSSTAAARSPSSADPWSGPRSGPRWMRPRKYFVQIDELAAAVGQRLAELTGAEWGMVSAGCAAGLKHVTAACVTGGNPERLIRIPDLAGFDKTEVVSPRYSRNVYDAAVRNIGVKMITVETPEELENALGPRTAMIYLTSGGGASSGPAVARERGEDREAEEHPYPDRCGRRGADDPERAPAERRDHRRLQRRQSDLRAAVRRPAPRPQGPPDVGVAGQRAAPRSGPRQQGRPRGNARACWRPSRRG